MKYAINLLSVIPMRKEPSHRSEMVSQLLFGEYATMEDRHGDFTRVTCVYDGYSGWVQTNQLQAVEQVAEANDFIFSFCARVFVNEITVMAPFGSPLYHGEKNGFHTGNFDLFCPINSEDCWKSREVGFDESGLETVYSKYLNTPYLWGGKSVYGIDCSGFVQQVFKFFGKKLLRDAYLQATQGQEVTTLNNAQPGDLAFFKNEKEKITHVGIILSGNRIVHASGRVRIDTIDPEGIINSDTGMRTHTFHSVRRFT